MKKLLLVLILVCLACPARAMTIEEAYQAKPHPQTVFDPRQANMSRKDAAYLKNLFSLTDEALRDRVEAMTRLSGGKGGIAIAEYNKRHDKTIKALTALSVSAEAAPVHKLIVEAVSEQADFLNAWAKAKPEKKAWFQKNFRDDPLVQSSHQKLVQGYIELLKVFPMEAGQNRQAFYDHLCALDFL